MALPLIDLQDFADDTFSPVDWINAACETRPAEEPLERWLGDVEMRLQLVAEDVSAALEDQSAGALARIPRALAEIDRVRDDAGALKGGMGAVLHRLEDDSGGAARSVAVLAAVDGVKRRMESAAETLAQAAGLADMFAAVERHFTAGDLRRVATLLAAMRKSLALVADVPDFGDGASRLAALEHRLESAVQPALAAALAARDGPAAGELRDILTAIGREELLARCYGAALESAAAPLAEAADRAALAAGAGPASVDAWLPALLHAVLTLVEQQSRWLARALPQQHPSLLLASLPSLLDRLGGAIGRRLDAAIAPGPSIAPGASLAALASAVAQYTTFARGLAAALPTTADGASLGDSLATVMSSAYGPLDAALSRYAALEAAAVDAAMTACVGGGGAGDVDALATRVNLIGPAAAEAIEVSCDRCTALAGGVEAPSVFPAIEAALQPHLVALAALFDPLAKSALAAAGAVSAPTPAAESHLAAAVRAAAAAGGLTARINDADRGVRAAIKACGAALPVALAGGPAGDLTSVRLSRGAAGADRARRMTALLSCVDDSTYVALPRCAAAVGALALAARAHVRDVLLARTKAQLRGVSQLPVWQQDPGAASAAAFSLPAFSAYPGEYMTALGESLLALPQQLEQVAWASRARADGLPADSPAAGAGDEDWLAEVVAAAAGVAATELLAVPLGGERAAAQMAADLEYLTNVLAALSVPADKIAPLVAASERAANWAPAAA